MVQPWGTDTASVPGEGFGFAESSWIVQVPWGTRTASMLPIVASLARDLASLKNVVIMVGTAAVGTHDNTLTKADVEAGWEVVVEAIKGGDAFRCTMRSTGYTTAKTGGGGDYHVHPLFGDDAIDRSPPYSPRRISDKLAYRLLVHSLALDCTSNQALDAFEYATDDVESLLMPIGKGE